MTKFCAALTLIFITLKLLDLITWSWIWVLSPIWILAIFGILLFLLGYILLNN